MKTKLLIIAIILMTFASYAQINIQERAIKNTLKDTPNLNFKISYNSINNLKMNKDNQTIQKIDSIQNDSISSDFTKFTKFIAIDSSFTDKIDKADIKDNVFFYDYFIAEKEKLSKELNKLYDEKKEANNDFEKLITLEQKINAKLIEVKDNDNILKKLKTKINDSNKQTLLFPSKLDTRDDFFENLYSKDNKDWYLLNNVSAQIGTNTSAMSTELISSYIKMVRISFGTLMTNSSENTTTTDTSTPADDTSAEPETDATDAFQRLLSSGGGNIFLNIDFPLFYTNSTTATLFLNSNGRIGTTLKEFSRDIDTSTGSGSISLNLYGSIATDDNKSFIFFLNSSFGGYGGGTEYYNKLNLSKNGVFAFSQLTLGVDIAKAIRVTYTARTFGSDESLRSIRGMVGIQLLKGLFD